jgi:drug/metabolite transporter (DMT)-like permease
MVYYGVFPTAFGFWLWYTGAALTRGAEAAAYTAVAPISALALSVLLRGEVLRAAHVVGMALVLAAIALVATARAGA